MGSADIFSILNVNGIGIWICWEIKTGNAEQKLSQIRFQAMIENFGGFYFIVREDTDVIWVLEDTKIKILERLELTFANPKP